MLPIPEELIDPHHVALHGLCPSWAFTIPFRWASLTPPALNGQIPPSYALRGPRTFSPHGRITVKTPIYACGPQIVFLLQ